MKDSAKFAIALAGGLVVGFIAGREQMKYQITSAMTAAMSGFADALKGGASSGAKAPPAAQPQSAQAAENALAYAPKLKIYDWTAKYHNAVLHGRTPGITFKVKNEGDKTVTMMKIVVYFQDANGNNIAEEDFYPILANAQSFSGDNQPLKPGYVWQQESNRFLAAKLVPSEWKEGATTVAVTEVEFE